MPVIAQSAGAATQWPASCRTLAAPQPGGYGDGIVMEGTGGALARRSGDDSGIAAECPRRGAEAGARGWHAPGRAVPNPRAERGDGRPRGSIAGGGFAAGCGRISLLTEIKAGSPSPSG